MPFVPQPAGLGQRMKNSSTGQGRVVLISGAGSQRGFGSTSAKLLAAHGARVVLTDLKQFEGNGMKTIEEIKGNGGHAAWWAWDERLKTATHGSPRSLRNLIHAFCAQVSLGRDR